MASNIEQNLSKILSSKYGKDVRQAIHDSIHDCYEDGKAGATDLVAREQIANLVANNNPTEGNSELQDIRVGYDGTRYASAGEATRKQVGSLSEDKIGSKFYCELIVGEFVNYKNGKFQQSELYARSDYIDVSYYSKIKVKSLTLGDGAGIAFFDKDKKYIEGFQINIQNDSQDKEYKITDVDVFDNARYFAFSTSMYGRDYTKDGVFYSKNTLNTILNPIIDETNENKDKIEQAHKYLPNEELQNVDLVKNEGAYIKSNTGEIKSLEGYFYTDIYVLNAEEKIIVTSKDPSGETVARISSWSEDGSTFIETISKGTTTETTFEYTAKKTEYIRFCGYSSYNMDVTKKIIHLSDDYDSFLQSKIIATLNPKVEELEQEIQSNKTRLDNNCWAYALTNIICCGDSLTSGANWEDDWNGKSIAQNIPFFLKRMLNCDVTNAGKSGWSASDWWRDYVNKDVYDFSLYDSAIVWLGTNYGCGEMPSDEEIESFVPSTDVLAENANQALYLIEIIKALKNAKQDMYIVLCNCFASRSNVQLNNETLEKIAEKYKLHLVDMSDLDYKNRPDLHADLVEVHFSKAGNIYVANRIVNSIQNKIGENHRLADFGYTQRID